MKSGPITVFNKTIYDITQKNPGAPDYLQFVGWVYLWAAILHWITAILNCNFVISTIPTSFSFIGC
jgi:boron transporter